MEILTRRGDVLVNCKSSKNSKSFSHILCTFRKPKHPLTSNRPDNLPLKFHKKVLAVGSKFRGLAIPSSNPPTLFYPSNAKHRNSPLHRLHLFHRGFPSNHRRFFCRLLPVIIIIFKD
ncbi:unnamed protein product [Lactuca virosa]|uniref:Uncharacterized protein n=1 Tax=Lactuca virosa TaxID=75947 RepID=A0AAU9N093_9ASTR|nr:unnamed protein product [Lactuca virosa]